MRGEKIDGSEILCTASVSLSNGWQAEPLRRLLFLKAKQANDIKAVLTRTRSTSCYVCDYGHYDRGNV
jgi:hypothetical protein